MTQQPSSQSESKTADQAVLEGVMECVLEVWAAYVQLDGAKTISTQGDAMNALSNHVSDLISWHPKYNPHTGAIDGVFAEDD